MTDVKKSIIATIVMGLVSIISLSLTLDQVYDFTDVFELSGATYRKISPPLLVVMFFSFIAMVYYTIISNRANKEQNR